MQNKKKIICIIFVMLLSISLIFIVNKNSKKYIMQDGMLLALTLDGDSRTTFPEGTNYRVEIKCENGIGKWLPEEWKFVVEDITGNVKCNLDFTTRKDSDKLITEVMNKATEISSTNNNGDTDVSYRYQGKKPDNYIWFNNEMWRIIGSIPTCLNSDCSSKESLVKIIRNESIGGLAFDPDNTNTTWGNNTLYTLLNSYYYGKLDATGSKPCYGYSFSLQGYALCNYTVFGISNDENDYYGKMLKDVYWYIGRVSESMERLKNIYTLETAALSSKSGKIGLMSLSDYANAILEHSSNNLVSLENERKNNWLYNYIYEWTLISHSDYTVFNIRPDGIPVGWNGYYDYIVRPVVYLDSNVYVVSGDGSITNPYQISM